MITWSLWHKLKQRCLPKYGNIDIPYCSPLLPAAIKGAVCGAGNALQGPLRQLGILQLAESLAQAVDAAEDVPPGGLLWYMMARMLSKQFKKHPPYPCMLLFLTVRLCVISAVITQAPGAPASVATQCATPAYGCVCLVPLGSCLRYTI